MCIFCLYFAGMRSATNYMSIPVFLLPQKINKLILWIDRKIANEVHIFFSSTAALASQTFSRSLKKWLWCITEEHASWFFPFPWWIELWGWFMYCFLRKIYGRCRLSNDWLNTIELFLSYCLKYAKFILHLEQQYGREI